MTNPSSGDQDVETAPGRVSEDTVEADERDATASHGADREPSAREAADADKHPDVPAESADAYKEAIERGANVKGEGQIDR